MKKIVLAYSGGLDTSIILKWLQINYKAEVIAYTSNIGQDLNKKKIIQNAKRLGVKKIIIEDLKNLEIPVITAINGVAAGAGCSLGIIGDLIFASDKSYFYQAFKFIGLVPDAGSTYILPRKIGMARAIELSMLGEKITAEKALSLPDLMIIKFICGYSNLSL